jgi:hypothetical protein
MRTIKAWHLVADSRLTAEGSASRSFVSTPGGLLFSHINDVQLVIKDVNLDAAVFSVVRVKALLIHRTWVGEGKVMPLTVVDVFWARATDVREGGPIFDTDRVLSALQPVSIFRPDEYVIELKRPDRSNFEGRIAQIMINFVAPKEALTNQGESFDLLIQKVELLAPQ